MPIPAIEHFECGFWSRMAPPTFSATQFATLSLRVFNSVLLFISLIVLTTNTSTAYYSYLTFKVQFNNVNAYRLVLFLVYFIVCYDVYSYITETLSKKEKEKKKERLEIQQLFILLFALLYFFAKVIVPVFILIKVLITSRVILVLWKCHL
jgi:uncharacterized membrane protein